VSDRPTWARWVTRISLAIAVAALVWTIRDIGLRTLGDYLRRIGWWWIAIVVFELACTLLDATAMRAFMSPDRVKLRQALLAQVSGRAINAVTPSGGLGEVVKISVLTEYISQARAVGTILLYNIASFAIELAIIATAATLLVVTTPLPPHTRWLMIASAVVCVSIGTVLVLLVRNGASSSIIRLGVKLRLVSPARFARWETKLAAIDDKLRFAKDARKRDRWVGLVAMTGSRLTSMTLSVTLLYALGQPITAPFIFAYTVGSFGIYFLSQLVPFGVGISEGGYYELFRALGWNPARGVTLVIARRVALVMYATIGLVLLALNETVKRAKREAVPQRAAVDEDSAPGALVPLVPTADE
jgi:hypothetical protein